MVILPHARRWKRGLRRRIHQASWIRSTAPIPQLTDLLNSESPLKRFASRYIYQGIDQILLRDLGFGAKTSTAAAPTVSSVPVKRPLPDDLPASPRIPEPRYRDDRPPPPRGDLPMKRPRPLSPPPRERERWPAPPPPENGWGQRRELSPPPRRVEVRGPPPPAPMPPSEPLDRSGLPKTIVWFLGNLPSARTFDGESGLRSMHEKICLTTLHPRRPTVPS